MTTVSKQGTELSFQAESALSKIIVCLWSLAFKVTFDLQGQTHPISGTEMRISMSGFEASMNRTGYMVSEGGLELPRVFDSLDVYTRFPCFFPLPSKNGRKLRIIFFAFYSLKLINQF